MDDHTHVITAAGGPMDVHDALMDAMNLDPGYEVAMVISHLARVSEQSGNSTEMRTEVMRLVLYIGNWAVTHQLWTPQHFADLKQAVKDDSIKHGVSL